MADLKTNYKDDIVSGGGLRRYRKVDYDDGTFSLLDVTEYEQVGDEFNASDINAINTAVNNTYRKSESDAKYRTIADSFTKKEVSDANLSLQQQINNRYTKSEVNALDANLQQQINNVNSRTEFFDSGWINVNIEWGVTCRRIGKFVFLNMSTNGISVTKGVRYDLGDCDIKRMGIRRMGVAFFREAFSNGTLLVGFKRNASVEYEVHNAVMYNYVNAITIIEEYA